jgi:dynein heavy chain
MMRTLRDMNMSKFVAEDVPLFLSLIDDLFPGLKAERASFPEVSKALEKVALDRGLQLHAPWLNKCIQLYETCLVRHGIMLVGPSGGGKTAVSGRDGGRRSGVGYRHL